MHIHIHAGTSINDVMCYALTLTFLGIIQR